MMRHRAGEIQEEEDGESSSDDDVFSAFSKKRKGSSASNNKGTRNNRQKTTGQQEKSSEEQQLAKFPPAVSLKKNAVSVKRHHGAASSARTAKMDALLIELELEKTKVGEASSHRNNSGSGAASRGSFVDPGDEHLTTNVFVGNLATTITEEQLTDLFRQFGEAYCAVCSIHFLKKWGDLYSVKIMWPRNPAERSRNRHTGFVCFMNRQDAEDAMRACDDADPFNVGRLLMVRWGKHVKKITGGVPIVKKGTGGIAAAAQATHQNTNFENHRAEVALEASLKADSGKSIRVVPPGDKRRAHLISTVASFVAKDGIQFESLLVQREFNNPEYNFVSLPNGCSEERKQEHIFYKWRVYAFCQGDGFHSWRVQPFLMFQEPNGCTWIPPPLDSEAARRESEELQRKEEEIQRQKQQRRLQNSKRGLMTGRQLEQARRGAADSAGGRLTDHDLATFDKLFKQQLCASREAICQAMAFCFEKSGAAKQISSMLRGMFLEAAAQQGSGTSEETMTARLFVISDVLYNSQQPGIRNAFLYRDAIEKMSPDVFKSLGVYSRESIGRMSRERLSGSVNSVLAAWTNWGVYDPAFLDELQARFEGREMAVVVAPAAALDKTTDSDNSQIAVQNAQDLAKEASKEAVSVVPTGGWVTEPAYRAEDAADTNPSRQVEDHKVGGKIIGEAAPSDDKELAERNLPEAHDTEPTREALNQDIDGADLDDDPDGEAFGDDPDGDALDEDRDRDSLEVNPDGEALDDDPDGAALDEDADGEALDKDPNGDALHANPDGEALDEDPDGKPFEEHVDGEALDDPDGEVLDEDPDGEALDDDPDGEALDGGIVE